MAMGHGLHCGLDNDSPETHCDGAGQLYFDVVD